MNIRAVKGRFCRCGRMPSQVQRRSANLPVEFCASIMRSKRTWCDCCSRSPVANEVRYTSPHDAQGCQGVQSPSPPLTRRSYARSEKRASEPPDGGQAPAAAARHSSDRAPPSWLTSCRHNTHNPFVSPGWFVFGRMA